MSAAPSPTHRRDGPAALLLFSFFHTFFSPARRSDEKRSLRRGDVGIPEKIDLPVVWPYRTEDQERSDQEPCVPYQTRLYLGFTV